jgi:cell division septum initiation protein DivIVA
VSIVDDIDAITVKILDLEQENERLKNDLETEKKTNASIQIALRQIKLYGYSINPEDDHARKQEPDLRDKLIGMIAGDIMQAGQTKNRAQYIYDVYNLFNELYPEGMKGEG